MSEKKIFARVTIVTPNGQASYHSQSLRDVWIENVEGVPFVTDGAMYIPMSLVAVLFAKEPTEIGATGP